MSKEHKHNSHGHHHPKPSDKVNLAFGLGIVLNLAFVGVEILYGIWSKSSALLADAGHNAGDVLSLILAWAAMWLASRRPKGKYTYGYKKSTIMASLVNAFLLFGAVGIIAWDAMDKFHSQTVVNSKQVIIVAGIGIVINTITALLFARGQKNDLNIKGAFLHMAADAAVSLGVVIGGIVMLYTNFWWIDSLLSLAIIVFILWSTWKLFSEAVDLALDAVPEGINLEQVKQDLLHNTQVISIHDLHIWALSTTQNALTVHVVTHKNQDTDLAQRLQELMKVKHGISHSTFQIEMENQHQECTVNC